jgi:glutaredoxin-like protein
LDGRFFVYHSPRGNTALAGKMSRLKVASNRRLLVVVGILALLAVLQPAMLEAKEVIKQKDREWLREKLGDLPGEVRLVMFTQQMECQYCSQTRQLLTELAALSDKLELTVYDFVRDHEEAKRYGVDKIPATVLLTAADSSIKYYGVPAGYELAALAETIRDLSRGTTSLGDESRKKLKELTQDVHIQVFVTPTCHYCPGAVRTAYMLAQESEHIRTDVVEAIEFPHLANKYSVRGVPAVIINQSTSFVGAQSEAFFLKKIFEALQ